MKYFGILKGKNMPFTKITKGKDKGKYKSPSGRIFNEAQVKLYYASGGFKKNKSGGLLFDKNKGGK
jgi:hypothetical protein